MDSKPTHQGMINKFHRASVWCANEFGITIKMDDQQCPYCDNWLPEVFSLEEYVYHLNDEDGLTFEEIAKDPWLNTIVIKDNKDWYENLDKKLDRNLGKNDA